MSSLASRREHIRSWWFEQTPEVVRHVTYLFLPCSLLLFGLGLFGDWHHWWEDRGYLTNVVSSLTSLLFGVPFALFFLSRVADAQSDAVELRTTVKRAQQDAAVLRQTVLGGFQQPDGDQVRRRLRELAAECREIGLYERWRGPGPAPGTVMTLERVQSAVVRANRMMDQLAAHPSVETQRNWLLETEFHWLQLDRTVRPHLEELGLSTQQVVRISAAVQGLQETGHLVFRPLDIPADELAALPVTLDAQVVFKGANALVVIVEELDALCRIGA